MKTIVEGASNVFFLSRLLEKPERDMDAYRNVDVREHARIATSARMIRYGADSK